MRNSKLFVVIALLLSVALPAFAQQQEAISDRLDAMQERLNGLLEENRELKNKNRLLEFKLQVLTDMLTCERLDSLAREQMVLEELDLATSGNE